MPNDHERNGRTPVVILDKKIRVLQTFAEQPEHSLGMGIFLNVGVIPYLSELSQGDPSDVETAIELANLVEINLGISQQESANREGVAPPIAMDIDQAEKIYQAAKLVPTNGGVNICATQLPDFKGNVMINMEPSEGKVALTAYITPISIDQKNLVAVVEKLSPVEAYPRDSLVTKAILLKVGQNLPRTGRMAHESSDEDAILRTAQNYMSASEKELLKLYEAIKQDARLDQRIGGILMGTAAGYKDTEVKMFRSAMEDFVQTCDLKGNYYIEYLQSGRDRGIYGVRVTLKGGGSAYNIWLNRPEEMTGTDQIVIQKVSGEVNPQLPKDEVMKEIS
jgi:hypothetical protein